MCHAVCDTVPSVRAVARGRCGAVTLWRWLDECTGEGLGADTEWRLPTSLLREGPLARAVPDKEWEGFCLRAQEWSREVDAQFAKEWEGAEGKRAWEAGWRDALFAMAEAPGVEVCRCGRVRVYASPCVSMCEHACMCMCVCIAVCVRVRARRPCEWPPGSYMRPVILEDGAMHNTLQERVTAYLRKPGPVGLEGIRAALNEEEFAERMEQLLRVSATSEGVALTPDSVVWKPTSLGTAAVCEFSEASPEGGKL